MNSQAVYTESGRLVLTFPFSRMFVELLKNTIPYTSREWDPERKAWTIDPPYTDLAIALLVKHFPDAHIGGRPGPSFRSPRSTCSCLSRDSDYAKLYVLPTAPPEVIRAAYRALTKMRHPDVGGSVAVMQELNAAFERVGKASQ